MSKKSKRQRTADPANQAAEGPRPRRRDIVPVDWRHGALLAGLVALIVGRTLVPEDPGGQQGFGAPFVVLWLMLAAAWLLGQLRRRSIELRFGWSDALVVALVGWHTVSALVAVSKGSPRPAMNMLWEWVAIGLVFLLARQIIRTAIDARAVIVAMLGLASGMTAVAVHQYFVTVPADIAAFDAGGQSTESLYELTGQWMPPGSPGRIQFEARLHSRLATGTFAMSNSLAGFLVAWLVVLVGLVFVSRRSWRMAVCVVIAAAMAACMWLTGSRSGGIAAIVGTVFAALLCHEWSWIPRRTWLVLWSVIGVLIILGGLIVLSTSIGHTALHAAWQSLEYRFEYWRATAAMIFDHPILGSGPGQFQDTYTAYKLVGAAEEVQDPHNWLLEVWATAGTPAAILLLAALGAVLVRTVRGNRSSTDSQELSAKSGDAPSKGSFIFDAAIFGGLAGVAIGMAVAYLTGFPIGRVAAVLLVAGIVVAWPVGKVWAIAGALPRWLPPIAAGAVLVNLLAAGGIGYSSVADSLWLLLAISLVPTGGDKLISNRSPALRWTVGLGVAATLVAAIWIEYLPVMTGRLQISIADAALAAGRSDQETAALEAAAAADPWSAAAASKLAGRRFAAYQALPTPTQIRNYREADDRARALAPRRSGIWADSAENTAAIYRDTHNVEYREASERYLKRAIELYPTLANLRAQAAKYWQSVSEFEQARDEAAEALRLDDAMRAAGHFDRYLDDTVRQDMQTLAQP